MLNPLVALVKTPIPSMTNHFIDTLPAGAMLLISRDLERVVLKRDDSIVEVDQTVEYVYLPINSIISVIAVMEDGSQVESRTIGREGGFGLLHALGSRVAYERVIVQVGGEAFRIKLQRLREAAQASAQLTEAIVRHGQATIVQTAQVTACNTLHEAGPRLSRWLLMTQDRLGGADVVPLTQEHLSIMLGVQRTTVTALAMGLQAEKMISYSRGKIRIKDREGLKRHACECYATITESVAKILADSPSGR